MNRSFLHFLLLVPVPSIESRVPLIVLPNSSLSCKEIFSCILLIASSTNVFLSLHFLPKSRFSIYICPIAASIFISISFLKSIVACVSCCSSCFNSYPCLFFLSSMRSASTLSTCAFFPYLNFLFSVRPSPACPQFL
jgi:hypothetical protein